MPPYAGPAAARLLPATVRLLAVPPLPRDGTASPALETYRLHGLQTVHTLLQTRGGQPDCRWSRTPRTIIPVRGSHAYSDLNIGFRQAIMARAADQHSTRPRAAIDH